jgi:hypothetical protein
MSTARITKYSIICLGKFFEIYFFFDQFNLIAINGFILCAIQIFAGHYLANKEPITLSFFILFLILEIFFVIVIARQPKNEKSLYFEVSFCLESIAIIRFFLS